MMLRTFIVGFAIIFFGAASGGFVPDHLQENKLVQELLNGHSETKIFFRIAKDGHERTRRSSGQVGGIKHVKDYMFALEEHHRIQQRNNEKNAVICATDHLGDCARVYPNVLETWHQFFDKRTFQARAVYPVQRRNNGQRIVASFGRYALTGYTADDVQAADLIVSRSTDTNQVVYGRYHFQVSTLGDILIHDDQQATCGTDEHSYFALGLNDDGHEMIRSWMNGEKETIEMSLRAQTMTQISRGPNENFIDSRIDIGANIEALILHLRLSVPKSLPESVFPEIRTHRRTRRSWKPRPGDCQRKRYIVSFKYNPNVISPETADIGICEGSCVRARLPVGATALNATGHTIKMLWNRVNNNRQFGNPEPKVCCFPNAYKSFYFVTTDHLDNLFVDYVEEMIAMGCSCR